MLVRKAQTDDAAAIAKVNVDTWRSAFCDIISDAYLEALSYTNREKNFRELICQSGDLSFAYVAEDEAGAIVGFTMGGREREGINNYAGEIYALYVSEPWQKNGVGKMLVKAATGQLFQSGISSLLLWTLAQGSACGFYEKLGGRLIINKPFAIEKDEIMFAAYGWDNIEVLL